MRKLIIELLESNEGIIRLNDIIREQLNKHGFQIKSFNVESLSRSEQISLSFTIEEKK